MNTAHLANDLEHALADVPMLDVPTSRSPRWPENYPT